MIKVTEYVIRFDARLKGWVAFKITKSGGPKFEVQDRVVMTNPKPRPDLAARALTRILHSEEPKP